MPPPFQPAQHHPAPGWTQLRTQRIHDGAHVKVDEVETLTPGRPSHPARWTIVRRKPAVGIAAFMTDGRWLLIQQERIPAGQSLWEFPAGQVDLPPSSDPQLLRQQVESTALTELREEAGLTLATHGQLHHAGHVYLSPGFTDEVCYLLIAGPLDKTTTTAPQGGELITQEQLCTLEQLHQLVREGHITNALTLALYAKIIAQPLT
jgi:ADP-ribose pyrophosphatase